MEIQCDFCGEKLDREPPLIARQKHHFCNKECYLNWRCSANWADQNHLPLADRNWLIIKYNEGLSQSDIAQQLNCTRACVSFWAKRHGLKWPRGCSGSNWLVPLRDPQWLKEACYQKSVNEIAQLLNCSRNSIYYWKKKQNIKTHNKRHSRPSPITKLNDSKWLKQEYEQKPVIQIAHELHCHPNTIYRWLRKYHLSKGKGNWSKPSFELVIENIE